MTKAVWTVMFIQNVPTWEKTHNTMCTHCLLLWEQPIITVSMLFFPLEHLKTVESIYLITLWSNYKQWRHQSLKTVIGAFITRETMFVFFPTIALKSFSLTLFNVKPPFKIHIISTHIHLRIELPSSNLLSSLTLSLSLSQMLYLSQT